MEGGQTTTNTAPAGNSSDFVSVDPGRMKLFFIEDI
jgi:hypothetical protein